MRRTITHQPNSRKTSFWTPSNPLARCCHPPITPFPVDGLGGRLTKFCLRGCPDATRHGCEPCRGIQNRASDQSLEPIPPSPV